MGILSSLLRSLDESLTGKWPEPGQYAVECPTGWLPKEEVREKKRSKSTIYQLDDSGHRFGFTDKPFEADFENAPSVLTERDRLELAKRDLDPSNPAYAVAKEMFSRNPETSKSEYHAEIPTVAKETFKDVRAAFRAAARPSPI